MTNKSKSLSPFVVNIYFFSTFACEIPTGIDDKRDRIKTNRQ